MKTVTEKYIAVNEGKLKEAEFVRQMRLAYPNLITQFNGYNDTVQILRNKGMLFEQYTNPSKNLSDDAVKRGLDYELTAMGLDPAGKCSSEDLDKAKAKAIANIEKDPLHYYNLLSNESSKVDKHDKYQEVKKNNHKDTFNDMKKASLNEAKQNLEEGTRALVGYLAGDRLTTAYNHYDGYPSNLGKGLETFYNDDEKAKDIAMKGYITHLDAETGEVKSTHNDPPKKIKLPEDDEDMAREVAEQIDGMGADYGYIWDDRANRWVTIKNTGIRSMIDQIMDKMGDYAEMEEETIPAEEAVDEIDTSLDPVEDRKEVIRQVIELIKRSMPADNEQIKGFIKTHYNDIINFGGDDEAILDEFQEFLSVNYPSASDFMDEKKGKDHDGDGDIDGDDYMAAKDKAIKKAMGKEVNEGRGDADDIIEIIKSRALEGDGDEIEAAMEIMEFIGEHYKIDFEFGRAGGGNYGRNDGAPYEGKINEAVKNIVSKVFEEKMISEAATQELARIADDYGDFEGLKPAIIALENIVTEIESFYDKTRGKIQKIYNDLGEVRNEEGLKVGAFIAPSIENAFKRDLRPITKQQFHGGLEMPKVKRISESDPVMATPQVTQMEAPKETVFTPVNEKK